MKSIFCHLNAMLVHLLVGLAFICAAVWLTLGTGCTTAPTTDQMNQTIANAATLIANGCKVVQPTLAATAVATSNADATLAASANGVFCASASAVAPVAASAAQ